MRCSSSTCAWIEEEGSVAAASGSISRTTASTPSTRTTSRPSPPEIPWDASAAQMKSAFEALDTVNVVQVRRCDASFLPNRDLTGTGAEAWAGRCPFGHLGGYTWVVEFERPRAEADEAWSWAYPRDVKLARDGWNERLQKDVKSAQEAGKMPLLSVWKETLSLRDGYKWSGPGAGIEVWRARRTTSRAGQPCTI